jgi:hypothetical protein
MHDLLAFVSLPTPTLTPTQTILSNTRNILLELHNLIDYANHELHIIHYHLHSHKFKPFKTLTLSHNLHLHNHIAIQ